MASSTDKEGDQNSLVNKRLVLAAGKGDTGTVDRLLRSGANVDGRYPPPLGEFNNGKAEVVGLDEHRGISVRSCFGNVSDHISDDFARTALQAAAESGHTGIARVLLHAGADVNAPPAERFGRTALQAASEGGHRELVIFLIGERAEVNGPPADFAGRTALQAAAESGHIEVAKLLIDARADVNAPAAGYTGRTALQAACWSGNEDLVRVLLCARAEVNVPAARDFGRTALQTASERGYPKLVELLISVGANVNAERGGSGGVGALRAARGHGHFDVVDILMAAGASEDGGGHLGSPRDANLLSAAKKGDSSAVERLLAKGADINAHFPRDFPTSFNGMEVTESSRTTTPGGDLVSLEFYGVSRELNADDLVTTALQVAAEGGHEDVVGILINAGADINELPGKVFGRTALQSAAECGHDGVVKLLIDAGADVNAPPAEEFGKTAIQAAAEGGHEDVLKLLTAAAASDENRELASGDKLVLEAGKGDYDAVALLLHAGTDVNARSIPPLKFNDGKLEAPYAGSSSLRGLRYCARTALQAAAECGHEKVVVQLIQAGANINALPATRFGRTALQAAAENGHGEVVKTLINAKADPNADPAEESGMTALQAAAEGWHEEVLSLLIKADVDINKTNYRGQNILHEACEVGDVHRLSLLLKLFSPDVSVRYVPDPVPSDTAEKETKRKVPVDYNARDFSGSTPLHTAIKGNKVPVVRLLVAKGVRTEITDNAGKTPLQIALEAGFGNILDILLEGGADSNDLAVGKLPRLDWGYRDLEDNRFWSAGGGAGGIWSLRRSGAGHTIAKKSYRCDTELRDLLARELQSPSIDLLAPIITGDRPSFVSSFVDPCNYLRSYNHPSLGIRAPAFQWTWAKINEECIGKSGYIPKFEIGTPDNLNSLFPVHSVEKVILVYYVWFKVPVHDRSAQDDHPVTAVKPLQVKQRDIEISWIMRVQPHSNPDGYLDLQYTNYRGTLSMNNLIIPLSAAEFIGYFIGDVGEAWSELFNQASLHLGTIRDTQLRMAGTDPNIIACLLEDGQHWNTIRINWTEHLSMLRSLIHSFRLVWETVDPDQRRGDPYDRHPLPEDTKYTSHLRKINFLEVEYEMDQSRLEQETNLMIELEFNLVSIFEARRSLKMSENSLSMTLSLKRLSWITFIFLPLLFVSGLFGMNVDLLASDPSWWWYTVIAGPLYILVLLIWGLFKYLPIEAWIEENVGSPLESGLKRVAGPPFPNENPLQGKGSDDSTHRTKALGESERKNSAQCTLPETEKPVPGGATSRRDLFISKAWNNVRQRRQYNQHTDVENQTHHSTPPDGNH